MNKVILIGRLTKDPEMRTTGSGINVTSFSVAVQRPFTDQNGERGVDFFNCTAWRKQAENIAKYCFKGSQVAVEGRLQNREYDAQDGSKRRVTEIQADSVTFLGSKGDNSNSNYNNNNNNFTSNEEVQTGSEENTDIATTDITEDPFKDFGEEVALSDDDLPF